MPTFQFRTEGSPAPEELVVVQGFLNTWSDELNIEDFDTPAATETWLRQANLWASQRKLTVRSHEALIAFRTVLRSWMTSTEAVDDLMRVVAPLHFQVEFSVSGDVVFSPAGDDCERVIGQLVTIISRSIQSGTWERLKCCALPSCGWSFYDNTRSRTRRWCSMQTCGSRHKAREYYKRKTNKASPPD